MIEKNSDILPLQEEKEYLINSINIHKADKRKDRKVPPYLKIATSVPFLAAVFTQTAMMWGNNALISNGPTYLNNIQHIPLTKVRIQAITKVYLYLLYMLSLQNGILSALPYLLSFLWSLPSGWLADWLITNKKMSRANVRKMMTTIGMAIPGIGMILLTLVDCNPILAVVVLCVSIMVNSSILSGFNVNCLELAPNYASTMKAIAGTFSSSTGFFAPILIGRITEGNV